MFLTSLRILGSAKLKLFNYIGVVEDIGSNLHFKNADILDYRCRCNIIEFHNWVCPKLSRDSTGIKIVHKDEKPPQRHTINLSPGSNEKLAARPLLECIY